MAFHRLAVVALTAALLLSTAARAIAPHDHSGEQLALQPSLRISASQLDVESSLVNAGSDASLAGRIAGFASRHAGGWDIQWDARGDRAAVVQGVGVPLLPGRGNDLARSTVSLSGDADRDLPVVAAAARDFIDTVPELLAAEGLELKLDRLRSTAYGPGNERWFLEFQQHHQGIPVDGAFIFVRIVHGNVVQFGSERIGDVHVSLPKGMRSDAQAMFDTVWPTLGFPAGSRVTEWRQRGELRYYPALPDGQQPGEAHRGLRGLGYAHVPTWRYVFRVDEHATWQVLVDARTDTVIDVSDLTLHADAVVSGGVYPTTNTDPQIVVPFPYTAVTNNGNKVTDLDGVYDYSGSTATATLNGKYFRMADTCGSISLSDGSDGNLELGGNAGTDCATPGVGGAGNTNASRTGFYHLTLINTKARAILPTNTWLQGKVTANMNIVNTCNATWDGSGVNFYRSGGGCSNTGEIAAVFLHEWGHGLDSNTGGTPSSDRASGEAVGDTFAFLETRDSCIGPNFRPGTPCYNCTDCTGVRDVGDFAIDGARTIASPATITANDGLNCDRYACPYSTPQGQAYRGPMGFQGHCESHIASTANWDLKNALVSEFGEAGWQRMDDIWYGSLVPSKSAYRVASGGQCNAQASVDGCGPTNWYTVYLAVDDDDGNLANGTPNACRIWDAFDAHGIACGTRPACTEEAPTGFDVVVDAPEQAICAGDTANFAIDVTGQAGFAQPVSLTLDGLPAGASAAFQPPVVVPNGSATLQIGQTAALAPGDYAMSVIGSAAGDSASADILLSVQSGAVAAPTLLSPSDGGSATSQPTFSWAAVPGATHYSIQVASDAGFATIVASADALDTTSWQPGTLAAATTYYWRAQAHNACGSSVDSAVFSFTTGLSWCRAPDAVIPDNTPAGLVDTMQVNSSATVESMKLVIRAEHGYVGDLSFTLSHGDTQVPVIVRPGHPFYMFGCGGNDIDVVLDDASDVPVDGQCNAEPPAIGGVLKPENPLAAFAGQAFGGAWSLQAIDASSPDAGRLVEWCLEPVLSEPAMHTVGGTVNGLMGEGLSLRLNGGAPLPIAGNGSFVFPTALPDGIGHIEGADVGDIAVTCTTVAYTVGGTVSGLLGEGLSLRLNGGTPLMIDANGPFAFPALPDGSSYTVTVGSQPSGPDQLCSIGNGTGAIEGGHVSNVMVTCSTVSYSVGGTVSGLLGEGLSLRLNGGAPLRVAADGLFSFPITVADGAAYTVTVDGQPIDPRQTCSVDRGVGKIDGGAVVDVAVTCSDRIFHASFE